MSEPPLVARLSFASEKAANSRRSSLLISSMPARSLLGIKKR
jgi:hypothetical protein